ncbi:MAG: ketoacyl-ACP synthase III [Treponema sp.]|jgi:3-oxoacyl-[acyl-carrier-protein] synthase-3|nr:ketoacyl-ACP synthase III [Treponema sp.]
MNIVIIGVALTFEIKATGRAVPQRRVSNEELAQKIDTSDEWIWSHTGIKARHIADAETASSDLGVKAAWNALEMAVERGAYAEKTVEELAFTLDMIIVATTTPDFYGCPSTACLIQNKLGAKNAGAMDISAACSGFIYGLETAAGLLSAGKGRKRCLVIGCEILSRFIDWNDRGTCVLFGDGAGAVLLEKTDAPREGAERRGLLRTLLRADGAGSKNLIIKKGGSRNAYRAGDVFEFAPLIEMNGHAVYNFAVHAVTEIIKDLLEAERLTVDELRWIVPHQANARIVQAATKRLGFPREKFFLNIDEYANTSAASIPIALDELNREGHLKKGDIILCVGFGAGLTYGGNLIVW